MEDKSRKTIKKKRSHLSRLPKHFVYDYERVMPFPRRFIPQTNHPYYKAGKNKLFMNFSGKINKTQVKTVDNYFQAAIAKPYVVDIIAPTLVNIDTTGVLQNLATIQVGTGEYNRVGNKVALKSLRIRFSITSATPTTPQLGPNVARLMVIYDRQPNGAYPTIANLLNLIRQDGTAVNGTCWSSINLNLLERFIVLMDKCFTLPSILSDGTEVGVWPMNEELYMIDEFIKLKNLETVYSNTASPLAIAQVQVGALYLLSLGDTTQANAPYAWKGETRLRFRDC